MGVGPQQLEYLNNLARQYIARPIQQATGTPPAALPKILRVLPTSKDLIQSAYDLPNPEQIVQHLQGLNAQRKTWQDQFQQVLDKLGQR